MSEPTTNAQMIDVMNTTIGVMQDNQAQTVAAVAALYGHNTDENAHGINEDGSAFNEAINDVVDGVINEEGSTFGEAVGTVIESLAADETSNVSIAINTAVENQANSEDSGLKNAIENIVENVVSEQVANPESTFWGNLPVASNATAGVIKASSSLSIDTDGTATVPVMGSATANAAGTSGLVPVPPTGGQDKVLTGRGWEDLSGIPSGVIVMWSGATTAIPTGWALCDGSNGTPDLRDRFVMGAGSTYAVGDTGGSATATISGKLGATTLTVAQMPRHNHTLSLYSTSSSNSPEYLRKDDYAKSPSAVGTSYAGSSSSHTHSFSGTGSTNLPPYYTLAYIMKL